MYFPIIAILFSLFLLSGCVADNAPTKMEPNIPPTAVTGDDLFLESDRTQAQLDGSSSFDLDDTIVRYEWFQLDEHANIDFSDSFSSMPIVSRLQAGTTYLFSLRVTDEFGAQDTSRIEVTVAAPPTATSVFQVQSSSDRYHVLYVRPDLEKDLEIAVSLTLGQEGIITLTEPLASLPEAHYRVEEYSISDPADIDNDGVDDITEQENPTTMNPLNPAPVIKFEDGTGGIPDKETFSELSYQGEEVLIDRHLTDLQFVKFFLLDMHTDNPSVYFLNTKTHRAHFRFASAIGISGRGRGTMKGEIVFHPNVVAPNGKLGVYRFEFQPTDAYSFDEVARSYELLAASMPFLEQNIYYYPMPNRALPLYRQEKNLYDASRVKILLEEDILPDVDFISFNQAEGYGLLRKMSLGGRPNIRDIVLYEALPNELSRVGGIITTVPQTPLSHVNLRAVQDGVPNAFIRDALEDTKILDLIGKYVRYEVDRDGFSIREATLAEVDAHYISTRPTATQTPERDLSVQTITPLSQVAFSDWKAFGVKAANVATLGSLNLPEGTVPDGFAVPFYFYDEFMKFNGFYQRVQEMLANPEFQNDFGTQETMLKELAKDIKNAPMPTWMMESLSEMHEAFPPGRSIRCRSSTNNEDLPGFSGAGLYDSKTQHPDEGHISKSIKQVYASLWNFRAFAERDFYRVDQMTSAMGVLVHPNFSDELANGVAVATDPIHFTENTYYVNTQVGEDLVTNPDTLSVPEELLLNQDQGYTIIRTSNRVDAGKLIMTDEQLNQLRDHLTVIQAAFSKLYSVSPDEKFAMEIEFKITSGNQLSIKQARPWVFN